MHLNQRQESGITKSAIYPSVSFARENALSINMAEAQTRQSEHESNFKSIKGELENFRHFLGIQDLKADEMAKLRLDNRLVSMKKNADELKTVRNLSLARDAPLS